MTVEEVTVVHAVEEKVASSSSQVEIVVEEDKEKEDEEGKEVPSNGTNGGTVKEDTDGEGDSSYVFVNGNDAENGDPVDLDLEKYDNGIGGEDRRVENLEAKGEVKSESDAVKDLEGEDESSIGIVDQDMESIEFCHVEGPLDEQKSVDLVESGPVCAINAEDGVSETSRADQNGVSESPEDVSDNNGDGSANNIDKRTVSEAAVVDSSAKQSDEISSVSIPDYNGSVYDCVEDNVIDSSSKENEQSEMTVADDGDYNGDGLTNDSAKGTVSEGDVDSRNEQNGVFESPVDDGVPTVSASDSNGDCLPNVSAKDNSEALLLDSRAENVDGVPVFVSGSNGGGSPAADTVEDTVSEIFKAERNESSNKVEAEAHSPAPVSNGNGERPEQNGFSEIAETVLPHVVPGNESIEGGENLAAADEFTGESDLDLEHKCERDLPLKVDTHLEKESSFSKECGEALPDVHTQDTTDKVLINDCVDSSLNAQQGPSPEQNGFSEIPETVLPDVVSGNESIEGGENLAATDEFTGESDLDLEHKCERDLPLKVDTHLEKESSFSNECGEALPDVHTQDITDTVLINDCVDSSLNTEQGPSPTINKDVHATVENSLTDLNMDTAALADVVEGSSSTVTLKNVSVESGVSNTKAETLPPSSVIEKSEVDMEAESGSLDDDFKSRCVANGLKSEAEITSDSVASEEAEVSKGLAECDSIEPVTVGDSSSVASLSNDEKAPAVLQKLSAVSNRDISGNDDFVHESSVSESGTNNNEQTSAVIKGGIQFGSVVTCQEPEGLDEVERRRPFYFLIRVPRYDDENLKEKITLAQIRVDEKTQSRDAIRIEIQSKRATCKEYSNNLDAAISQERAARDLLRSKRQEIDSIQSLMSIDDIDAKIRNMEHMIQHETLPLKDEKQFIHQIKQLKQGRERLSSNMGRQDEVRQGLGQKDQIKERMQTLKKEAEQLKLNLLKAEAVTKAAKKEYHDETEKLNALLSQFKAADDIRQEAYAQLRSLKKQSYEKNKYYWQYRDDAKAANDLASKGDREALQNLCVNQVEKLMELWNNDDKFRKEYIRCNVRSTLRRLRTLDGRALGPDEEPPVIPQVVNERVAKEHTVSSSTLEERAQEKLALAKAEKANDKPVAKSTEQNNRTIKSEKSVKSQFVPPSSGSTTASSRDEIEKAEEEKPMTTKEEEEAARKAEELRKEEEAAKLREQRRLEEIAKAKEALERKRRIAEKAQARAEQRAQKEVEQKEKEREKRAKKKERRKVAAAAIGDASVMDEIESAPTSETLSEAPKESESKEKPVTMAKRSQKPSQFTKQTKAKSVPPPLRNRGKRKMQSWMWVLLTSLVVFALFLVGNYNFSFNFGLLQRFNF